MAYGRLLLVAAMVVLMSTGVGYALISTANDAGMPPPVGDDNYGIGDINTTIWEGQQIMVTLPLITGVDFAVLHEGHPWHSGPDLVVEMRIYLNDGAVPDVANPSSLLASKQMQRPLSETYPAVPGQTFTHEFVLDTPLDVSGYVGAPSALSIVWGVVSAGGSYATLHDPGARYTDGLSLISYNSGGSWGLNGARDLMFHVYGDVPEPMTLCLLGFGGLALLRKRRA